MATDYSKLKVTDLRAELKRLGLPQNGLKAELVARLEEAQNGTADTANENAIDTTVTSQRSETLEPATPDEAPQPQPPVESQPLPTQNPPEPSVDPSSAANSVTPAAAPASAEISQDIQTRQRRSGSPAPKAGDIAHKTLEAGVDDIVTERDAPMVQFPQEAQSLEPETNNTPELPDAQADDIAMHDPETQMPTEDNAVMVDAPSPQNQQLDNRFDDAMDKDVEQSIHPATNALYIKNFMRPLRPQEVQSYLLELASPPNNPRDENLIVDFFLDSIKTHALVVFTSISAASRVRNALHDRVWPDETNRKPLWVDFIPPEHFQKWVAQEEGTGGRGSSSRWEIVYTTEETGQVKAELVDGAGRQQQQQQQQHHNRPRSISPQGGGRRPSIPTGPALSSQGGIQGAPTGPRSTREPRGRFGRDDRDQAPFDRRGGGGGAAQQRRRDFDGDMLETRTFPIIPFKPVPRELAESRLDAIARAKSKTYDNGCRERGNKEYRRYYFENGDMLVDRGPEIFLGIRPPHRERERRRGMGRDSGPRGNGGGGGGRRAGGGRRRRRHGGGGGGRGGGGGGGGAGFAMYHGVPRGGDRFRPSHHDS